MWSYLSRSTVRSRSCICKNLEICHIRIQWMSVKAVQVYNPGTGEITQLVKCKPCKHYELSSDPKHPHKKPDIFGSSPSLSVQRDTVLKDNREIVEDIWCLPLDFTYTYPCEHMYNISLTHTYIICNCFHLADWGEKNTCKDDLLISLYWCSEFEHQSQ